MGRDQFSQKKKGFKAGLRDIYHRLLKAHGHQDWWPAESEIEFLVGVILTQNTAWTSVEKALLNLKEAGILSYKKLLALSPEEIAPHIKPAGYFNLKAKRLKSLLHFIDEEYGSIKKMYQEEGIILRKKLLNVHGVGRETADSILLYGAKYPFFVIDAYTKRILSRHGLLSCEDSYEVYQEFFHKHTRRDEAMYNDFHAQIVRLCKNHCRSKPLCEDCPLNWWEGLPG